MEIDVMPVKRSKPWKKAPPKRASHTKLSPAEKQAAKRSAKRAGRPYPNLVDNMKVASRKKKASKKTGAKKKSSRGKNYSLQRTAR
jgi:hypothetical protein